MRLVLDRDLPVPLGAQLRGLIEYGIACGELAPGERLPSVRDLADELRVAAMTVGQVYRDLRDAGLIETRAGSGTFIARREERSGEMARRTGNFHRHIDLLVEEGFALGLRSSEIAGLIAARLSARQASGPVRQVVMAGIFPAATAGYARAIAEALGKSAIVEAITIDVLQRSEADRQRAASADLVLTFAHRRREVEALLGRRSVTAISFIPAEATRRALASLDPRSRVLVVSRFPEFLPVMKPGVQRFAPHVSEVAAVVLDAEEMEALLPAHDVVVFASGAERVLEKLDQRTLAIEYRHIPDPGEIERIVVPLVQSPMPDTAELDREAS
ncbi:transcriptional regulator, GntR family [Faunimonas pinastri]|uniref:Transcriptional regulator, GntR family n=1 Tax=Faunimonas pinastri TaxID=1855383 RepID=A0A1H9IC57_9HYPH|nr:GntR family transcriptional regulator [Faunimonas pinastri]SEQ72173.1 transcriptional regulator, GntR family [Faunimonas pinastri]